MQVPDEVRGRVTPKDLRLKLFSNTDGRDDKLEEKVNEWIQEVGPHIASTQVTSSESNGVDQRYWTVVVAIWWY